MNNQKVLSLEQLAAQSSYYQEQGYRVVLCHGTFDLLHIGHIRHLAAAKREGDRLLVTITADYYVNKGPGRPVFNEKLRAEQLAAIEFVNAIAINYEQTSVNVIHKIKPNVYVKGSDYKNNDEDITGNIYKERVAVESIGGHVFYTNEITFSSSKLLNENFDIFPSETKDYLEAIKQQTTAKKIIGQLETLKDLNVLVVGDTIIDEYYYISTLGQSGKCNVLAAKYKNKERFAGGAIAVANHVAEFVNSVTLLTGLGEQQTEQKYIESKLKHNIIPAFIYCPNAPTLIKRRYVDEAMAKLFEVYYGGEYYPESIINERACQWLEKKISQYDAIIIADYGNGFITTPMIERLCDAARFLAVNTQVNSGNRGFHAVTKYSKSDFISLNEPELRLATHSQQGHIEALMDDISNSLNASYIAVTRGTEGVLLKNQLTKQMSRVPALSTKIVDCIGAGDAFLAIASILLAGRITSDISAFIASAAAAIDVQIVCNRDTIASTKLHQFITTLLK